MGRPKLRELGEFLSIHRHTKYELGVWDCALIGTRWIDYWTGANTTAQFLNRYSTEAEMAEYFKTVDIEAYLVDVGYLPTSNSIESGDIILNIEPDHVSAWLALNNCVYTMTPRGMIRIPPSKLKIDSVWRHYG